MEVKTTDTDITVNLQVLFQVLVAILVSLDIL
ncbi:spore coat protein [Priestia megaterium]